MNSKTLILLILGLVLISSHFVKSHPGHDHSHSDEEYGEDSKVVILGEDNFQEIVSEHDLVLIKFYAPWCGHCKKLAPAYKEAAEKLSSNNKVVIAKVDCTQEEDLCTSHGVQGYPTLILYNKGKADKYEGGRKSSDIVTYIEAELLPPVTILESAKDVDEYKEKNILSIIGFFDNDHDDRYQAFLEVVSKNKRNIKFGAVINKESVSSEFVKKTPGVVMFRPFDEPKVVYQAEDFSSDELDNFVAVNIVPLVGEINGHTYKLYEHLPTSLAYLFINPEDESTPKTIEELTKVAKSVHGKLTFCWVNMKKFAQQATHMGLSGKVIPALSIESDKHKYNFAEDAEFTPEAVTKFVNDVLEGKVEPFLKSEPIPESNDASVKVIVGKTYSEIVLDETKDVFVEFYAPWCGHCKSLAPIFDQLGEYLKDVKSVVVAKVDATANDVPSELNIRGFPTLLLFKADDKSNPIPYNGMRDSFTPLAKFIQDNAAISFDLPTGAASDSDVEEEEVLISTQGGKKDTKPSKEHDEL